MEPYIILDGVSKSFRSVEVLKPLSIEFEEGLIHGIVGRNGSGKTVMMKLILGFLKPTQGTVTVGKKRVGKDVDFPQDVGAIIENVDFIPYLNAYDNLYNLAAIRHRITKEDVKQVLETVGLGDTGRKKVAGALIVFQMLNIIAPQIEDGRVVAFLPRIKVNGIFVTYPI